MATTKYLRQMWGLTQQNIADTCGVSVRTVQNWEYRDCAPEAVVNLLIKVRALEEGIAEREAQHARSLERCAKLAAGLKAD